MKKIFFILFFAASACTHLNPQAEPIRELSSTIDPDTLWVRVSNGKDSLIRSNPTHFWAWMKQNTPEELKEVTSFTGQVTADPHFFNFADIHTSSQSGLALVDVDDSGEASLYFDFVRYALFVKAYLKKDYTAELMDSYKDGLKQKPTAAPSVLKKSINHTRRELENENYDWVLKNLKKDYSLDNNSLGLTSFKKLNDPSKVNTGLELKTALLESKKASVIYDTGYLVNDSGSSRGLSRYWFSLLKNDETKIKILECKQLSDPATSYYKKQKQHNARIRNVLKYYSDYELDDSFVFNVRDLSYWCRPKHFQFLKREDIEKDLKPHQTIELAKFFAHWLGVKQAQQPNSHDYIKEVSDHRNEILKSTIDLINRYEDHVFKLK